MGRNGESQAAVVAFADGREAGRRVAGLAAAARIVRALAEAGHAEVRLAFPAGHSPSARLLEEVRRLAGPMRVGIAVGEPPGDGLVFPGDRLPGEPALRFDRPGASAAILRATGKAGDGPVSRWLNRPVSRFISALLLAVPGIRPWHATVGTALLAVAMFVALVRHGGPGLVAGALLYQAASIFDGVDGEIARATFRASRFGAILDSVVDAATNLMFIVGLAVNLGWRGEEEAAELAGWGFALMLVGLGLIAWRTLRGRGPFSLDLVKHAYRGRFSGRLVPALIAAATVVSSRDFFALLFALLVLAGFPIAVLYLFAAAGTVWMLFVLGLLVAPAPSPSTLG